MEKQLKTRVCTKSAQEKDWKQIENSFVPYRGELICYEIDGSNFKPRFKIGDGSSTLAQLGFIYDLNLLAEKTDLDNYVSNEDFIQDKLEISNKINEKQDKLIIEETPTTNSKNPISSGAVKNALKDIVEIAEGKCATYVFDYKTTLIDTLIGANQDIDFIESLHSGDIFLIRDLDSTDYWWEPQGNALVLLAAQEDEDIEVPGYGVARVLESRKMDLSGYALKNEPLSSFTTDSTHRLVTDNEKSTWNNKSNFSGSYKDLTNKPIISNKGYTNGATWYFEIGKMVIDNSGNYGSFTFSGRIGGWTNGDTATHNIMLMNRGGYNGNTITSAVSSMGRVGNALSICDLVVNKNSDLSHTVYLKCNGYYCFDLQYTEYQHYITYNGSYTTTAPSNIIWTLSGANKTILDENGVFSTTKGLNATTINGYKIRITNNKSDAGETGAITFIYS